MAKIDLRNKILNAADVESEIVEVKQWDVKIKIKGMTGKQRDALLQGCINQKTGVTNMEKMNTQLVLECCFDPDTDEKVFEAADADLIANKSAGALSKVIAVASRLSGLDEDTVEKAEKN